MLRHDLSHGFSRTVSGSGATSSMASGRFWHAAVNDSWDGLNLWHDLHSVF